MNYLTKTSLSCLLATLFLLPLLRANDTTILRDEGGDILRATKKLPSGDTVIVHKNDGEPESIGSYSVRLYGSQYTPPPVGSFMDDFLDGIIRPRDGSIIKVVLVDLYGDRKLELVVVTECVGTGSFHSADAFFVDQHKLKFLTSVGGLEKHVNPIAELRNKIRVH